MVFIPLNCFSLKILDNDKQSYIYDEQIFCSLSIILFFLMKCQLFLKVGKEY